MSLILRKLCQEKLDDYNLPNFHVDISKDTYNRVLTIVSECGKPLIEANGIVFTRSNPTKDEIIYAVELLEAFLVKHGADIQRYLHLREDFTKRKEKFNAKGTYTFAIHYTNVENITFIHGPWQYTYSHKDGLVKPYDVENRWVQDMTTNEEIFAYSFDKNLLPELKKASLEADALDTMETEADTLKTTLSSCTI